MEYLHVRSILFIIKVAVNFLLRYKKTCSYMSFSQFTVGEELCFGKCSKLSNYLKELACPS